MGSYKATSSSKMPKNETETEKGDFFPEKIPFWTSFDQPFH